MYTIIKCTANKIFKYLANCFLGKSVNQQQFNGENLKNSVCGTGKQ